MNIPTTTDLTPPSPPPPPPIAAEERGVSPSFLSRDFFAHDGGDDDDDERSSSQPRRYPTEAAIKIEWVRRVSRAILDYHASAVAAPELLMPFTRALLLRHAFGMPIADYIDLLEPLFVTCKPATSHVLAISQTMDEGHAFYGRPSGSYSRAADDDGEAICLRQWIGANPEVYDAEVPFFAQLLRRFGKYLTTDCSLLAVDADDRIGRAVSTQTLYARRGATALMARSDVARRQRRLDWLYTAVAFYQA
jgi:hypothetical protein